MKRKLGYISSIIVLLSNTFYFLPMTFEIIRSGGGSWGIGLIALPMMLIGNAYIIPAVLSFLTPYKDSQFLLGVNISGGIGSLFWIYMFLTIPG